MKDWIVSKCFWIIGALLFLFILKSCQSGHRGSTIEFNRLMYEDTIDSLENEMYHKDKEIFALKDTIAILEVKLDNAEQDRARLHKDNTDYKTMNTKLINKVSERNESRQ